MAKVYPRTPPLLSVVTRRDGGPCGVSADEYCARESEGLCRGFRVCQTEASLGVTLRWVRARDGEPYGVSYEGY